RLLARSDASAWQGEERAQTYCSKVEGGAPDRIRVTTDANDLAGCDLVVEAVIEDMEAKIDLLHELGDLFPGADLASTTSSLPVAELAARCGHPDRVFGLHFFNPVPRMELVELCLPQGLRSGARERALAWCAALGKAPIEVPDQPGFVVNRLLFPYLFDAVRLLERSGLEPEQIDACMKLGASYPMGPLELLDLVGIDVADAIGEALHADTGDASHRPPGRI